MYEVGFSCEIHMGWSDIRNSLGCNYIIQIGSTHVKLFVVLLEYCVDTGGSLVFRGVGDRSLDMVK